MIFCSTDDKKVYKICNNEGKELVTLYLKSSPITNKFTIICEFIQSISKYFGEEFDNWFENVVIKYYSEEEARFGIIENEITNIKKFVDGYINSLNIDFESFINRSKTKKTTIVFQPDEIEKITKASGYLKLYSIFSNTDKELPRGLHRVIYNRIISDISYDIITKIFDIIKTKTYRYSMSDRFMWDYVKAVQCKSIDVHVSHIFNFIMNNILVLCVPGMNPITFFVTVTDESVRWVLRSVYKETIVYTDSIMSEEIQTSTSFDNLNSLCYNYTLGKVKQIAYERLFGSLCQYNENEIHNRLQSLDLVSPLCEYIVFPLLSQILEIPYENISYMCPEHAAVLSIYCYYLISNVFKDEYKTMFTLLNYAPEPNPKKGEVREVVASSYKVRKIHDLSKIQQELCNFYGFNCKVTPINLINSYMAKINKMNFIHIETGQLLYVLRLSNIEKDMIDYFARFFAGKFSKHISCMRKLLESDL